MFSSLGKTDYSSSMSELDLQYRSLIRQAEKVRRLNDGKPSIDEARLYEKASVVCDKIIALNIDTPHVKTSWMGKKSFCLDMIEIIIEEITPQSKPAPDNKKPAEAQKSTSGSSAENKAALNVTSEDGKFTTRNACKDVSAETIRKWYYDAPDHGLDDVIGMESIKAELNRIIGRIGYEKLLRYYNIKCSKTLLFYGPTGSGKTFVIEAFISELMRECNFKYLKLTKADISSSLVGVADKIVQAAFREAIDNSPCIIFIDEIEPVCGDRNDPQLPAHEKNITVSFLNAMNEITADKNVIFVAATNHPVKIDEAMLNRVDNMFSIPFPDENARYLFFKEKFSKITLTEGLSLEYIADVTAGYSYRDLNSLCEYILGNTIDNAISKYADFDDTGKDKDKEATVARAIEDEQNGNITSELSFGQFEDYRFKKPPTLKEKMQSEYEEFEKKIGGLIL